MSVGEAANRVFDILARTEVRVRGRSWPAFRVCGAAGIVCGVLVAAALVAAQGRSLWVLAALAVGTLATFLTLAMVTKIVLGYENLVLYHQYLATLAGQLVLLWLIRQPVLPYLDATSVGLTLGMTWGRAGCLMVGCCHGKPHRWGVRYSLDHVVAGHTYYYAGIRLFPVQAVEALATLAIAAVGSALVLVGRPPGDALAWCVVAYGLTRFSLEFARGDPYRPRLREISEAQWTSLALLAVLVAAEWLGAVPFHAWHSVAAGAVAAVALILPVVWRRQGNQLRQLRHPHHVLELADAIGRLGHPANAAPARQLAQGGQPPAIPVERTSRGICLSVSTVRTPQGMAYHYALSAQPGPLAADAAGAVAGIVAQLWHAADAYELVAGSRGVFHLLVYPPSARRATRPAAIGSQPPAAGATDDAADLVPAYRFGHEFGRVQVLAAPAEELRGALDNE